jgi:HD superfamily phosphohydrolase YqeK
MEVEVDGAQRVEMAAIARQEKDRKDEANYQLLHGEWCATMMDEL